MNLLILNYEYPPLGGGAGLCTRYQAEGLAARGHAVTVISTWFEGERETDETNGVRLIRLKSRRKSIFRSNPLEMVSWAWKAFAYIHRHRLDAETDLILAHFAIPGGLVALPVRRLYRIPYFIVSHGQDIPWFCPEEMFLFHLFSYFPIRRICIRASRITVLSPRRLRDLNRLTGRRFRSRHHVIPNGCDVDFFSPGDEEKQAEPYRILFAGRLRRQKDPFSMLKAVDLFRERGIPFVVDVAGDGPLRTRMESYARDRGLGEMVIFHGWLSRRELREKYRGAHVLLITSRDEGMSLAMLEAMASGLYILTTRVSGSDGLICEGLNGSYIPFQDPARIAESLEEIYRSKILKGYTIPGPVLRETRDKVGWDHYVRAYEQLVTG